MAYKRKSARRRRESFPPLPGESQEFEALAVSTPGFLFTHSPGGGLEFTGQYFYEYTGAPEGTATGTGWAAYLHPADLEVSLRRWNECVQSGKMFEVEYRVRRHDGEYRWFKARSTPLRGPLGTIVKWFGLAVDIHDQKLAERALASSEERLRLAMEATNDAIWDWDLRTNTVVWGSALQSKFGYKLEDVGHDATWWYRGIHRDDQERVTQRVHSILQGTGPVWREEYRFRRADGSYAIVSDRGSVIRNESGVAIRMIGAMADITERKRAEAALIQSEKLATVGRLSMTIAHEINNPLEAVTNLLYILQNDPSLNQIQRSYLQAADAELARVSHIAKQTLGFYKDSSVPQDIDVESLVQEVIRLYESRLMAKGGVIDCRHRGARTASVPAGELRQIVSNLLSNSVDAIPFHGAINVRIRVNNRGVRVTVADDGPGIPFSLRKKIFEPFFTTKRDVGTGLGLWVSAQLISQHGGSLRLHSRTEGATGTVFSVFLPDSHAQAEAKPRPLMVTPIRASA
jgi:PAS domain S-box-containing protein